MLSSDLIKNLDKDKDVLILLPDYSASVVQSFVRFLYSGEALIDMNLRADFISLCKAMLVNIPDLLELENVDVNAEEFSEECINEIEEEDDHDLVTTVEAEDLIVNLDVEMQEDAKDTDDSSTIERDKAQCSSRDSVNASFDISYKPSSPNISEKALAAIQRGDNLMEIARRFGIPKSTLYRWKKKIETVK